MFRFNFGWHVEPWALGRLPRLRQGQKGDAAYPSLHSESWQRLRLATKILSLGLTDGEEAKNTSEMPTKATIYTGLGATIWQTYFRHRPWGRSLFQASCAVTSSSFFNIAGGEVYLSKKCAKALGLHSDASSNALAWTISHAYLTSEPPNVKKSSMQPRWMFPYSPVVPLLDSATLGASTRAKEARSPSFDSSCPVLYRL